MEQSTVKPLNPIQESPISEVPVNVPTIENNPPAVPLTPKAKSKLMPVLLIILVLVLLGVGGAYAYKNFFVKTPEPTPTPVSTPEATPDPTADWKIYTNSLANYSIKYPSTWLITDLTQGQQIEIYYQPDKTKSVGAILIENMTATGYANETQPGLITDTKMVSGIEAKCKTDNIAKTWCFIKNDEKYISILTTKVQGQDDYNETLDQILSTFKFTDDSSSVDTSNWKTFSDTQYGISLKYPENQYTIDNPPKIDCPTPVDNTITRCNLSVIDSCSSFECTGMITITIYLDPNDPTYKSNLNDFSGAFASSKIVDSNINGIPVKMRTYSDAQKIVIAQMYYVTTSKHSYLIYGKPNDSTFNQIISTLKISQ